MTTISGFDTCDGVFNTPGAALTLSGTGASVNPLTKSLGLALKVIRHHHEKLDGSGYPDGLKGEEIPKIAQVMAVVDIYDALVTDRSYRKGMDNGRALSILREEVTNGKLDKGIIDTLEEMIDEKAP